MKPTPKDWPRLSSAVYYEDAVKAIDWLCNAFGFQVRLKVEGEGGRIMHSELTYGEALIMPAQSGPNPNHPEFPPAANPRAIQGANTQSLMLFVDDVNAHCEHARANGARIIDEPKLHDYGPDYWADRSYGALDLDGHLWWFTERVRDPKT